MQRQTRNIEGLQYISTRRSFQPQPPPSQPVQGAYATTGSQFDHQPREETKGIFSKLKEGMTNLFFEEAEADRPIGISQLTRQTFQATDEFAGRTIFKSSARPIQDYRFNQLVNTAPRF